MTHASAYPHFLKYEQSRQGIIRTSFNSPHNTGGLGGSHYGFVTNSLIPAIASWTVEGYIGNMVSANNTGTSHDWGIIDGTTSQPLGALAGIHFDLQNGAKFVWPGGGQCALPGIYPGEPTAAKGTVPGYFALSYDGVTVNAFVNGMLLCSIASTTAALPSAIAGFMDHGGMLAGSLDEFRVSNIGRYSAAFAPPTSNFADDANTMLLVHFDDYGLDKFPAFTASNGSPNYSSPDRIGAFGDASSHSNFLDEVQYGSGCVGCAYYSGPTYNPYSLGQGVTADEVAGGGLPWACSCTRKQTNYPINSATGEFYHAFSDLTLPGRGISIDLNQTYSSVRAAQLGRLGYGWNDSYSTNLT